MSQELDFSKLTFIIQGFLLMQGKVSGSPRSHIEGHWHIWLCASPTGKDQLLRDSTENNHFKLAIHLLFSVVRTSFKALESS